MSPLERRAKARRRAARRQRKSQGDIEKAKHKGRSAEHPGAAGGRTDYTPQPPPVVKPPVKGKPGKHSPNQIGPKEGYLKVN